MRTNCSNPPTHGGTVVSTVLNTPELYTLWTTELATMRERIRTMRVQLVEKLKAHGVTQDFDFVLAQRGMFSYSGLTAQQVDRLRDEHGVYAVSSGRSEEHTSELQSLMRISYAVFCLIKKK